MLTLKFIRLDFLRAYQHITIMTHILSHKEEDEMMKGKEEENKAVVEQSKSYL